jgi:hypothetical protein
VIHLILPKPSYPNSRWLSSLLLAAWLCLAGCAQEKPLIIEDTKYYDGDMPADFSGLWARDYSRGKTANQAWRDAYYELAKKNSHSGTVIPTPSQRDVSMLRPLARLVELITRMDQLAISQTEHEILVERKDDFALMCAFFNGVAKPVENAFGRETCGWIGDRLISVQDFPDGLRVVHQIETSDDRQELRVITTASSDTAPMPFTVSHYYRRFEKVPGRFECIETLSRKRVCGIGTLSP